MYNKRYHYIMVALEMHLSSYNRYLETAFAKSTGFSFGPTNIQRVVKSRI
jgi:hypothetical protein